MTSRTDYLESLVGTTADDIAGDLDTATEPDDYWTALHAALLRLGWHGMKEAPEEKPVLLRIPAARVRCGLTTSEATRTAVAREAEQRLMNERAARRAG